MSWFWRDDNEKKKTPDYTIKVERSRIDRTFVGIIYRGDVDFCHKGMVFAPTAEAAEEAALRWIQEDQNGLNGFVTKVWVEGLFITPSPPREYILRTERVKE